MTQAQARRWASGALIVAAVAVVVTLLVGALTDAWLIAIGVATPIALLCALLAFFMLRAVPRQGLER